MNPTDRPFWLAARPRPSAMWLLPVPLMPSAMMFSPRWMFFYASDRALLVSHWEVDNDAAVKLVTAPISAIAKDKSIGPAEALRRAMLAAMADTSRPAGWIGLASVHLGAVRRGGRGRVGEVAEFPLEKG